MKEKNNNIETEKNRLARSKINTEECCMSDHRFFREKIM